MKNNDMNFLVKLVAKETDKKKKEKKRCKKTSC